MLFSAEKYTSGFSHSGGKVTDLSRIAGLLQKLDNPHAEQKFVHIAGTNGKGSTLEYMSRILISAGYKTGQFTSPYIEKYNDRIRINGKNIPDEKLNEIAFRVKNAVSETIQYSQFEITLAIALIYFKEENCDIVFLETGIGGLLDATNIIKSPLLSVITSVSSDHTQILGSTIPEIAAQKAGIIKNDRPVILAADNTPDTIEIVKSCAAEHSSSLTMPDNSKCTIINSDIYGNTFIYKNEIYKVNMCGIHQVSNALTAIEAAEILKDCGFEISSDNIKNGLSDAKVRLRAELLSEKPIVIADGGHNISGIDSLIKILETIESPVIGAVGMVKGKAADYAGKRLSEIFDYAVCADGFIDNALSAQELKKFFSCPCETADCKTAVKRAFALANEKNAALVICGSLYFASAARKIFFEECGYEI